MTDETTQAARAAAWYYGARAIRPTSKFCRWDFEIADPEPLRGGGIEGKGISSKWSSTSTTGIVDAAKVEHILETFWAPVRILVFNPAGSAVVYVTPIRSIEEIVGSGLAEIRETSNYRPGVDDRDVALFFDLRRLMRIPRLGACSVEVLS